MAGSDLNRLSLLLEQVPSQRGCRRESALSGWHLAMIHLGLGERDRALELLDQAYRDRAWELRLLPIEPLFDSLRSDRRFAALVSKVRSSSASLP